MLLLQAQPLLEDREKFSLMADPLLKDNFPVKGLFKALAVAAMCLQAEADTRPLMSDVVSALQHITLPRINPEDIDEDNIKRESIKFVGHVESFRIQSLRLDSNLRIGSSSLGHNQQHVRDGSPSLGHHHQHHIIESSSLGHNQHVKDGSPSLGGHHKHYRSGSSSV